jgi:hypothetical protein
MQDVELVTKVRQSVHDRPAEDNESVGVVGVILLAAVGPSELIQSTALMRIVALEKFGLLDEKNGYVRFRQSRPPNSTRDAAIPERDGKLDIGRADFVRAGADGMVKRQNDGDFEAPFVQRSRQ